MTAQEKSSSTTILLPDLVAALAVVPDHGLNVLHEEVSAEARAWIKPFNEAVCGPKMRTLLEHCNFELFATLCYPYAGKDGLRAAMDLFNALFLYDEFTDTHSGQEAYKAASVVQQAFRDPSFDDASWLCLMFKDYRERHMDRAGPDVARRLTEHLSSYVQVVGEEAANREHGLVLDFEGYIALRRETSAMRFAFDLVEYFLEIDLQEFYEDPVFVSGYNAAMDLTYLANDLYSYNMEQAKGHGGANAITVIMKCKSLEVQAAVDFIGGYCESLLGQWQTARETLAGCPGEVYSDALRVLDAMGDFIRGNIVWSSTSPRYFGARNMEAQNSRCVALQVPFSEIVNLAD